MERLYVIGAVTGKPDDNIEEFMRVREALTKAGYDVDIPHDFIATGTDWKEAMLVSINHLTRYDFVISKDASDVTYKPIYDGVAMLDGWSKSDGAKIEHDLARAFGIKRRPWWMWVEKKEGQESLDLEGGEA